MTNISIEFLEDKNGKQQVLDLVYDIAQKSKNEKDYQEIAMRIAQVFAYLKETGVPPKHLRTIYALSSDGFEITLVDIVKELTHHKPLLETRVNWPPVGAFRAIFFYEKDKQGNQTLYYTKAVIKNDTYSQEFEDIVTESEVMMNNFYIKRSGQND